MFEDAECRWRNARASTFRSCALSHQISTTLGGGCSLNLIFKGKSGYHFKLWVTDLDKVSRYFAKRRKYGLITDQILEAEISVTDHDKASKYLPHFEGAAGWILSKGWKWKWKLIPTFIVFVPLTTIQSPYQPQLDSEQRNTSSNHVGLSWTILNQ